MLLYVWNTTTARSVQRRLLSPSSLALRVPFRTCRGRPELPQYNSGVRNEVRAQQAFAQVEASIGQKLSTSARSGGKEHTQRGRSPVSSRRQLMPKKGLKRKAASRPGLTEELTAPESSGIRVHPRGKRRQGNSDDEGEAVQLDEQLSTAILRQARDQQAELNQEDLAGRGLSGIMQAEADAARSSSDSDDDGAGPLPESAWEEIEEELTLEDAAALEAFMLPKVQPRMRTLGDIIAEKLDQHAAGGQPGKVEGPGQGMDPKLADLYRHVGELLSRYKSGKLPKAFKIIPNLRNWQQVLQLTDPAHWSPHAVYQATRLFVSSLNARMAQRFLALVLLPHIRNDIEDNKRLHHALFQAIKKATYKPDAFFKGLILPLCQSGDCTLREAVIITSALQRASIPVLHSAAALLRLADMPYGGTTSFFIRVLLDKKYALPYRVVDGLVDHFVGFERETRTMPVVWHQSLLTFVQRYKNEIRGEDREALRRLIGTQYHYQISPEVSRELDASRSRGEKPDPAAKSSASVAKLSAVGRPDKADLISMPPIPSMDMS